jgi:2-polyprenyl-3-methyl-5-hydroxy-6-metoxy-1,4-benzoquinol methylase
MSLLARALVSAARIDRRARRALGRDSMPPRERLIAPLVRGRSFLDVGCMWSVDGAIAFAAEQAGASSVTGIDVMEPSAAFEARRTANGSNVRFVRGDLHDPALEQEVGPHDIVWCSGLLYHAPHPLLSLQRLRTLCGERLILATEVMPEVPGLRGACVFYPSLRARDRAAYGQGHGGGERVGLDSAFESSRSYENWWWGITPSALDGMLRATGFEPLEEHRRPFHTTVVARAA